jgi:hypothetical protein
MERGMPGTERPGSRDEGTGGIGVSEPKLISNLHQVHRHYQFLSDALAKMADLAEGPIDQDAKDRFAMYNAIADKHWKVVARYAPPESVEPASEIHEMPGVSGTGQRS